MAKVITMPRLSDTMTEGVVASWLKQVGDTIKQGDILAEIETDKATMEFESFHDGVLLHIGVQVGETAPVAFTSFLPINGDFTNPKNKGLVAGAIPWSLRLCSV
jgi:pyruvate dehydrogenase E2 component (dihydrolipoamide acetyltransferase)